MAPKLYKSDISPPSRSVILTAKALGVELEFKEVSVVAKEHLMPAFLKINPQHTIPTFEDDGYVIWDSHAIMAYLVGKYAKDDSLYPKDLKRRAMIDQRLYFDNGVAFVALRSAVAPLFFKNQLFIPAEKLEAIEEVYDFLNTFLDGHLWAAGNEVTIADFSLIPTVTSLNMVVPISAQKYPNVTAWTIRAQSWPFYDANSVGLSGFKKVLESVLK